GDVYGEEVSVEVITHIRDVVVVNDSRELKELISQDIQNVRKAYDLSRS
ncbi:MAG: bifunctional riboflavin kinase/FAD synthetase, partial [Parcubacteria group bacterium]|nr:bifunctional riboflavin kinase/FAD synthetase [Parcubacteria group bacterium]